MSLDEKKEISQKALLEIQNYEKNKSITKYVDIIKKIL